MTDSEFDRLIADLVSMQVLYIAESAPKTREVVDKAIAELKRLRESSNAAC